MAVKSKKTLSRREFIEKMTALGVATAVIPIYACGESSKNKAATDTVYRLKTRETKSCNACQKHQRYKVFLNYTAADNNRAHPGCNCPIVTQQIPSAYLQDIKKFEFEGSGVIDLRFV